MYVKLIDSIIRYHYSYCYLQDYEEREESLDPISMEHIDLLDDWISEEPGVTPQNIP